MSEVAQSNSDVSDQGAAPDQIFTPGQPFAIRKNTLPTKAKRSVQSGQGRRSQATRSSQGGYYVGAIVPQGRPSDIAIDASLRVSALRNATSFGQTADSFSTSFRLTPADLRVKQRQSRAGNLILFVVDASGSMGARKRMTAVKGAILSLLLEAYQKRDRVGLITFRGEEARLLVPPTNSVELAERQLRQMPTGGRTPLAAGLNLAEQTLTSYTRRDLALMPLLVLITDGRANSAKQTYLQQTAFKLAQKPFAALVLDSEQGFVRMGLAHELAGWLGAQYLLLDELRAETIARQVRRQLIL